MSGIKKIFLSSVSKFLYYCFLLSKKSFNYQLSNKYRKKYKVSNTFEFIGDGIVLEGGGEIILGEFSHIARNSWLSAFENTKIEIGTHTRIASNVTMITSNTKSKQDFSKTMERSEGNIMIGDHCWIGVNVYIKEGVTIGNNCIVGANAVVTKNIPDNSIVTGVNKIRKKFD